MITDKGHLTIVTITAARTIRNILTTSFSTVIATNSIKLITTEHIPSCACSVHTIFWYLCWKRNRVHFDVSKSHFVQLLTLHNNHGRAQPLVYCLENRGHIGRRPRPGIRATCGQEKVRSRARQHVLLETYAASSHCKRCCFDSVSLQSV